MNHATRTFDLKQMLSDRRREVLSATRSRVPGTQTGRAGDMRDELEGTDATTGDTELALVRASLQTVARIDDALARLDGGKYGSCLECAREISERRLSAWPFALRCQTCEERRQQELSVSRS
jgi:RNA polymerase-binding transcription factor